jgi:hypothetical protein
MSGNLENLNIMTTSDFKVIVVGGGLQALYPAYSWQLADSLKKAPWD